MIDSFYPLSFAGCFLTHFRKLRFLKQTNLIVFYKLGQSFEALRELSIGMALPDVILHVVPAHQFLVTFLLQVLDMRLPDSTSAAKRMLQVIEPFVSSPFQMGRTLTQNELIEIINSKQAFEQDFERETHNLDVFTVTPKGIYNTRDLIECAESKFPENIRKVFPNQTILDIQQAGRCLAFEVPTACAFHVCRAAESVILKYYEALKKKPWAFRQRDWGRYIEELKKERALDAITSRLDEIRKLDRNVFIHPEKNVSLEESPFLFELCTGVMYQMGQEIIRLTS